MSKHHHFNLLTPAQDERLACLMEECAEVIHMIGKIMRHGYNSCDPFDHPHSSPPTNRQLLEVEIGDVFHALKMMMDAGDIDEEEVEMHTRQREEMAPCLRYHHQNE